MRTHFLKIQLRERGSSAKSGHFLDDKISALSCKSNKDLLRASLCFSLFRSNFLVDNSMQLMTAGKKILGENLFSFLMKNTVYGQFIGGEDKNDIENLISELASVGIRPMLNYTVEEDIGENLSENPNANGVYEKVEAQADRYVEYFKISVEAAKKYPNGLAAIKLTPLARPEIIFKLSSCVSSWRKLFEILSSQDAEILSRKITRHDFVGKMRAMSNESDEILKSVFEGISEGKEQIGIVEWMIAFRFPTQFL